MEMQDPRDQMIRAIVYTVLGLFTAGVVYAGWLSHGFFVRPPHAAAMPTFVKDSMNTINGTLALNLGAYFGIKTVLASWDAEPVGYLQKMACWVYVGDGILATIFWALLCFTDDTTRVASVLPTVVTSGFGVVLAVFGAALGFGKKS